MFKTIDPLATKLGNRLGILHRSFIDINTDIKTLSKANGGIKNFGHLFNIATKQDIQNFEQFNRVIEDGQNIQRSYNTYLSSAPTSLRQLGKAIVDVKKEQYDLNTAYNQGKISQDDYNNRMRDCNIRLQELRGSSNSLTLSQKALNAVMRIGSTVLNMAFNAAIGMAISAIISVIQKAINAEQELIQKNKELADTYKDNIETLKNYREQYLEILDSSDSEAEKDRQLIEWKKQLIKQYGLEEEALRQVNQERQTGVELINKEIYKEAELTIANLKGYEDAYNKIYNAQSKVSNLLSWTTMRGLENYGIIFDRQSNGNGSYNINIDYKTKNAYEQLDKLGKLLSDLKSKSTLLDKRDPLYTQDHAELSNQINFIQKEYDRVKKVIDDYGTTVSTGVSAYAQKYLYEFTQQTDGALANIIDRATFNAWKDKLLEMAGDSEPVKESLAKLADEMFPDYSSAVDDSIESNDNAIISITSLNDAFAKLKELLEDIIGYAETYQSAMKKIASGTGLTTDEVLKLLEIDPSLYDKFTRQLDGTWTIDLGEIKASYQTKIIDGGEKAVEEERKKLQTEYDKAKEYLQSLEEEYNNFDDSYGYGASPSAISEKQFTKDKLTEDIKNAKDMLKEAEDALGAFNLKNDLLDYSDIEIINELFDGAGDKIDDYNKGISSLNDAIDALNEGNSLSYDDMTKLVNLYPQLQDKVTETNDGYQISGDALEDVRIQSYTTRNDYIDDRIAETEALKEEVTKQIEEYRKLAAVLVTIENIGNDSVITLEEYLTSDEKFQKLQQQLQAYDDVINKLQGYKRTITNNDNNNSSTKTVDIIQQQIDYYKTLLEAVEIVTDKVIDSLEQEKEALKEKNDEQQRELDLLEAKNNLEKAKKQKVFVYKEGQGLVQVQDEKAVKDAQKKYDDIQNEIKEAEIDKQIDNWTKYKEQFSDMENNVKDTLIVEQAKKALGTDEKGLLSLDDKTINGIRDGLATATYNKDVEDNKENSEYVTVKLEDFLKSVGATVTPTEFKAMASAITNNPANIIPATNANSTVNNAQTINNKTANFNATFNIYDALDPYKIIDTVKEYFNGVLKQTINSVK